jgi:hypothetical protein
MSNNQNEPKVRVRAVERGEPELRKLARALLALAKVQLAEDQAKSSKRRPS